MTSTGSAQDHYFLPPEICIMEVKVNQTVPYWLTQIIAEQMCVFRRISKYCSALEQSDAIRQKQRVIVKN
ncbi:MAG: hypothetical protein HC802_08100 [Caldilineaceae bacterium]|nr:hypothetical protein [Caldilineaceae bacterium]